MLTDNTYSSLESMPSPYCNLSLTRRVAQIMEKTPVVSISLLALEHPDAPSASSSVFDLPTQNHPPPEPDSSNSAPIRASSVGENSFIVISGGTGCNSLCSAFGQDACYVLPVSDDGGSSSEIIRVIGSLSLVIFL